MKFIHCADIHLDSPMTTHLPPEKAKERRQEIRGTFLRLIAYAKQEGVRAVLIAGDLFDTRDAAPSTVDYVLDAIEKAEGVDFLYLRGNHDESARPLAGRRLPENLKTFSEKWTYYSYGNVTIAGAELNGNAEVWEELSFPEDTIHLALLHGNVTGSPEDPETIPLPPLRGKQIRYLALGHLHRYQHGQLDLDGDYAYAGCLEGRGFDECGEKGFVLLDIDEDTRRVTHTFVPFARRTFYDIPVSVNGLETEPQILRAMKAASAAVSSENLVRFTLSGESLPEAHKDLSSLRREMSGLFYCVEVRDESHLAIDPAVYEHDVSLKGELIRLVRASDLDVTEQDRVIRCGIQALRGVRWEDLEV